MIDDLYSVCTIDDICRMYNYQSRSSVITAVRKYCVYRQETKYQSILVAYDSVIEVFGEPLVPLEELKNANQTMG